MKVETTGQNSNKKYWADLCKDDTGQLCNTEVGKLPNCSSGECVSVKISTKLESHPERCNNKHYFVCQFNKGNEIFLLVLSGGGANT